MPFRHPSRVQDAVLFLVLVILFGSLLRPWTPQALTAGFYLALLPHIAVTAYDGRLAPWRRASWRLLILGWVVSELAVFLGFVIPWGQLSFWLASLTPGMPWPDMAGVPVGALLLLALLGLDLLCMHGRRWRARPWWQGLVFLAAAAGIALAWSLLAPASPVAEAAAGDYPLLPPWHGWPIFALLRAVPGRLGGVALVFAMLLAPLAWPWLRAERFRGGWVRRCWPWLCLAWALAWIGLGWIGGQAPEGAALWLPLPLAAYHFAFFLILPWCFRPPPRRAGS